ncbi:hypothetical protein B0I35DRAFT_84523 [Stachybotrys elegans]|uniref:GPI inositol-deacylase n=1 Tax=Stachybotrys elegans TaxID=80388 RepID=A0A8K0SGZ2_9HYPO|nr:hypothetical protein B0I35DRAFT_84523 [Stachybotrys elegans]
MGCSGQFLPKHRSKDSESLLGVDSDAASSSRASSVRSKSPFSVRKAFSRTSKTSVDGLSESKRGTLGLNLLHSPEDPQVDFIFVHGLGGDSRKTWCKSHDPFHFWPKEWLPKDPAFSQVRIHTYGYDSDYRKGNENCLNIHHIGKSFLADLSTSPHLANSETSIVAIGHSMGGLVIKKAYILGKQGAAYKALSDRFIALYFLATPHRGVDSAKMLKNILKVAYDKDRAYIADLGRNSESIQVINDEFRHFSANLELWSFYETEIMKHFTSSIVDPESAVLGYREEKQIPLKANHRSICKFDSESDANYLSLRNALESTIRNKISLPSKDHYTELQAVRDYLGVTGILDDDFLAVREARISESCKWICNKEPYRVWANPDTKSMRILWVNGKPATGKSVLAGYVVDTLQEHGNSCSYYFFKHGDKFKSKLATCIRSLALQMAGANPETLNMLGKLREEGISLDGLDERSLWRVLFSKGILRSLTSQHYWVIDALDECSKSAAFFDDILTTLDENIPLRILITSRDTVDLNQRFLNLRPASMDSIRISSSDTFSDLQLLIESKAESLAVVNPEDRSAFVQEILEKSRGSFLWTILVLNELLTCHSKKEVNKILAEVPRGMEELYKRTLDLMSESRRGKLLAHAILIWACCSVRPMSTEELNGALELDIEDSFPRLEESISALCGQLVFVDKLGKVHMVHETAREFLMSSNLDSEFAVPEQTAHTRIAIICLTYVAGEELRPPRPTRKRVMGASKKRSEFSKYACTAYSYHLAKADPASSSLFNALEIFFKSNISSWIEIMAESQNLNQLIRASKHLTTYLNAYCRERSPLDPRVRNLKQWIQDLSRLAIKFSNALTVSPSAIHSLLPPFCPTGSMIYHTNTQGRRLMVLGNMNEQWDDRLSCIDFRGGQPTSVCYGDELLAVGLTTGSVALYLATSYQEYKMLEHGESVRLVRFKPNSDMIATCGLKKTKVWDVRSGKLLHTLESPQRPLDMAFRNDKLLVASHKCFIQNWDLRQSAPPVSMMPWKDSFGPDALPPNRSPCAVTISVSHEMVAVAYSGRPITLWDLEGDSYYGSCGKKLPSGESSTHLVVCLCFNPNPSIGLLAVTYLDGDLAVLDPFTDEQLVCFRANCQTLAASPNGRILAAGAGDGVIQLYEFDTLKLLYRVKSFSSYIKHISFTHDNLRLADIRGAQCTVWEPGIMLRDQLNDDSSWTSATSHVDIISLDSKGKISTVLNQSSLAVIFCGKEDGAVELYSQKTAACLGLLYAHKSPVRLLAWCEEVGAILSFDASGRIFCYKLQRRTGTDRFSDPEMLFQSKVESDQALVDVLVAKTMGRFVVSTRESDHLFSLDGGVEKQCTHQNLSTIRKLMQHPTSLRHAVSVDEQMIRVFSWEDWSEVRNFPMPLAGNRMQVKSLHLYQHNDEHHFFIESCELNGSSKTRDLQVYDASLFAIDDGAQDHPDLSPKTSMSAEDDRGTATSTHTPPLFGSCIEVLGPKVLHIIGVTASKTLVFLDHSFWVCSFDLRDDASANTISANPEFHYKRHFFVPYDWFAGRRDFVCCLTLTDIVICRNGDLTIVRHWSDHVDRVRVGSSSPLPLRTKAGVENGAVRMS